MCQRSASRRETIDAPAYATRKVLNGFPRSTSTDVPAPWVRHLCFNCTEKWQPVTAGLLPRGNEDASSWHAFPGITTPNIGGSCWGRHLYLKDSAPHRQSTAKEGYERSFYSPRDPVHRCCYRSTREETTQAPSPGSENFKAQRKPIRNRHQGDQE